MKLHPCLLDLVPFPGALGPLDAASVRNVSLRGKRQEFCAVQQAAFSSTRFKN